MNSKEKVTFILFKSITFPAPSNILNVSLLTFLFETFTTSLSLKPLSLIIPANGALTGTFFIIAFEKQKGCENCY